MSNNPNLYFTGIQRSTPDTQYKNLSTLDLQAASANIESLTSSRSPFVGATKVARLPSSFYALPFPSVAGQPGTATNGLVMVDLSPSQNSIVLPTNTAPTVTNPYGQYYYLTEMLIVMNNFGPGTGGSFANTTSVLFGTTAVTSGAIAAAPNANATIGWAAGAGGTQALPPITGGSVIITSGAAVETDNHVAGFNNLSNPGGTAFGTSNSIVAANATQCNTFGLLGYLTSAAAGSSYLTCGFTPAATAAATNATGQFYIYLSYVIINPF